MQIQLAQQLLQHFIANTILIAKLDGGDTLRISQIPLDSFRDVVLFRKHAPGSSRTLQGALTKPIVPGHVVVNGLGGVFCPIGALP